MHEGHQFKDGNKSKKVTQLHTATSPLPLRYSAIFRFFTLPVEIPDKIKLHPQKLYKIVFNKTISSIPLEIPYPQSLNPSILFSGISHSRKNPNRKWERIMYNFHGSWFFALEFPRQRVITKFCTISTGQIKLCFLRKEYP